MCTEAQWGPDTCSDQQAVREPHPLSQIPGPVTHPLVSHLSWCLQLTWGHWWGPVFGFRASACVPGCSVIGPDSNISLQRDLATPPSPSHPFTPAYGEPLSTQSCCSSVLCRSLPVDMVGSVSMQPMTSGLGTRAGGCRGSPRTWIHVLSLL